MNYHFLVEGFLVGSILALSIRISLMKKNIQLYRNLSKGWEMLYEDCIKNFKQSNIKNNEILQQLGYLRNIKK